MSMVYPILFCVVAVAGLLIAEGSGSSSGKWVNKPVAAAAYVWLAMSLGATETAYGRWLLWGLLACLAGDILLIPTDRKRWFQAGIVAFLAGHLLYIVAFLQLPIAAVGLGVGVLLAAVLAGCVWRWLGARLPAAYRRLVQVYIVVICTMLVVACGAADGSSRYTIALGAGLFALSDVAVARDRFVHRDFRNRLWGLPLYFCAQMILASTVAA